MNFLKQTFYRFTLDQKIIALITIEFLGLLALTLVAFAQLKSISHEVEQLTFVRHDLLQGFSKLREQSQLLTVHHLQWVVLGSTSTTDAETLQLATDDLHSQFMRLQERTDQMRVMIERNSTDRLNGSELHLVVSRYKGGFFAGLEKLESAVLDYRQALDQVFWQAGSAAAVAEQLSIQSTATVAVDQALQSLGHELDKIQTDSTWHLQSVERVAVGFLILTSIIALIFFVAVVLLIVRMNISKPLQLLTDTINTFTARQRVDESELEFELMGRRDELGRMSRSFNRLKHDLWHQGQELEDAREQAENANRGKSMFLAAASHDLRQPLNAMQMYIAALRLKTDNAAALKIVDDIDAVSLSTAKLLNALLDVSQLEVGVIEPQYEDFAVQEVLRRTHRSFSPLAKQKGLQFKLVQSSAWVHSDPVLLERILGNFISNAIRYTSEGEVLVGCRRRGGQLSIEVLDTGCGIPPDQVSAIFEDFHQLENSERDRSKGLGLGLAIARRLSLRLGHEIACESAVAQGSHFAVRVDAVPAQAPATASDELTPALDQPLTGIRILLIEDDFEVLKATAQLLRSWGCVVDCGRDMSEINQLMSAPESTVPDLIVADYRLPGNANGMEVATRVQLITGRAIPVVIVTGDVEKDYLKGIAEQGYRVLHKPVRPAKLRALITHLLSKDS